MLCFVDSNVVVYWFQKFESTDDLQTRKQTIAGNLIHRLATEDRIVISTQVIGETFNAITRKGKRPLSKDEAADAIDLLLEFPVIPTDITLARSAVTRSRQSHLSYYDALIVEAAIRSGASILYTEDLHHGTRYGSIELCNPFLP